MQGQYKNNFYFWERKIRNADDVLFGNLDKKRLTRKSVIIYLGILDTPKGLLRSGWSSHGDVNTALGFLQHVFLPTVFYTWIDRESDGFYIPLSPFHILKDEVLKSMEKEEIKNIESDAIKMEIAYQDLNSMWKYNETEKMLKLKAFCNGFNSAWDQEPEKKLFVKVFEKSEEIVAFILENTVDELEEVIEEEIEMSIEQLRFICKNAYDESFINKNIIELLNTRIPIWF
ncbi:hypothetical protein [Geosporobacter ferrireducens]|uniref:Uncharacterized protein n=1 Tax=Geosporobacter ferrireducens TaxID=1424294 RepID=A0A1D8GM76_9FIRM|nr:hypothetical protein [Geosporobacter ferrireducens]AOT72024.1 hypothetical protein Gferi_22290 [Geosporobacter ferrireducens]MTI55904.1 hypothetical protein [Geosporobacter ferrireducens]